CLTISKDGKRARIVAQFQSLFIDRADIRPRLRLDRKIHPLVGFGCRCDRHRLNRRGCRPLGPRRFRCDSDLSLRRDIVPRRGHDSAGSLGWGFGGK
ncbi:MAG: hypothetical protein HYZ33_02200, partial [Ignavibacteriales bacterium]|nr:hypothetical protein [Ignavibacteriales bacterium]